MSTARQQFYTLLFCAFQLGCLHGALVAHDEVARTLTLTHATKHLRCIAILSTQTQTRVLKVTNTIGGAPGH